jgi:rSAM/selenodomain-associated transferase 1
VRVRRPGWIVVFAKEPRAGRVKTRLVPPFSDAEAAALYEQMLLDVLDVTARAARAHGMEAVIAVDPPGARAALAARAPSAFRAIAQRGPDLGARMTHVLCEAAGAGASPVLLRGSDSPALSEATLASALEALATADLVVCPDRDGGYNLVGLRRSAPQLFRHPMSTRSVLRDTLAGAEAAGLECVQLEPGFDIDVPADLCLLEAARRAASPPPCPRTLAFLDETGLWRHAKA